MFRNFVTIKAEHTIYAQKEWKTINDIICDEKFYLYVCVPEVPRYFPNSVLIQNEFLTKL